MHEVSKTLKFNGKWVNVKSMQGGKELSEDTLADWLKEGRIKPLGGKTFETMSDAVSAAKRRSAEYDKTALTK